MEAIGLVNQQKLEELIVRVKTRVPETTDSQIKALREYVDGLQSDVNQMKTMPQFRQYVQMRKLHLLDSKLQDVDNFLSIGILE